MDGTTQFLLDLASNSPFLAWMIWQHSQLRKDLKAQRAEYKQDEEELRSRYQQVIDQYNTDKERQDEQRQKERRTWFESIEKRITALEKAVRGIYAAIKELKTTAATVEELKLNDQIRRLKE